MKKVILFTFLFFSLVVLGQAPTRFPGGVITSKVVVSNSTNDSVLLGAGGRKAINTIVTDTTHLSARINTKQPIGTYATGTGTAYNSNNGDETLTSIKTKLGSANSTTDGYVKYQDWNTFNGKQNALGFTPEQQLTFGTGLSRTGNTITNNITQYTDALARAAQYTANSTTTGLLSSMDWNTFNNKLSSISYNQPSNGTYQLLWGSGNNIYGNSNITCNPYTGVLSATQFSGSGAGITGVIFNQNTSAQSGNMWIIGDIKGRQLQSTVSSGTPPLTVNSTTLVDNLNVQYLGGSSINSILKNIGSTVGTDANNITDNGYFTSYGNSSALHYPIDGGYGTLLKYGVDYPIQLYSEYTGNILLFRVSSRGNYSSWKELYHSGNLTNNLTTNYLPKWNGSNMVNSLISDEGTTTTLHSTTQSTSPTTGALVTPGGIGANNIFSNSYSLSNYCNNWSIIQGTSDNHFAIVDNQHGERFRIFTNGNVGIGYTTDQGYKLAVNGNVFASGFKTSRNSASYLLATDGSDVAVSTIGGGVNETQQTINASGDGSIICSQPFRTSTYKKVLIYAYALNGYATYNFPVPFTLNPILTAISSDILVNNISTYYVGISSTSAASGWVVLEGY